MLSASSLAKLLDRLVQLAKYVYHLSERIDRVIESEKDTSERVLRMAKNIQDLDTSIGNLTTAVGKLTSVPTPAPVDTTSEVAAVDAATQAVNDAVARLVPPAAPSA